MSNVRDSDTSLWLHNKLGTSNDTWIGGSICSQLNSAVLRNIRECFVDLQTQVKLKLLLTFLNVPRKHIEEWQTEVEEVLAIATQDSDQWVSMLAEVMQTYPATGSLNTDIGKVEENQKIFLDLIDELKGLMKKNLDLDLLPLECHYLNRTAFGQIVQPERHFSLRRRPSAATLRADLLRRAGEASAQLARHASGAVPHRSRSAPRRPDSAGTLSSRPAGGGCGGVSGGQRRPPPAIGSTLHQARTVKMLDIAEQPSSVHGRRRRKAPAAGDAREPATPPVTVEEEPPQPAAAATPDYAAGLQSTHLPASVPAPALTPVPAPAPAQTLTPAPAPTPAPPPSCSNTAVSERLPAAGPPSDGAPQAGSAAEPLQPAMYAPQPPQQQAAYQPVRPTTGLNPQMPDQMQQMLLRRVGLGAAGGGELQPMTSPPQPQPPQVNTDTESHHLTLTREQMLEAQEMFSTANKVTRPEKALILGFIAGSRDNPCPHLGDVVTIKLSESAERLAAADAGPCAIVVAETHFQMNYATGEWKRIKKFRRLDKAVG